MQVIILAAGASSRFYPFNITHKTSLVLLGKTIIEHTLLSVKKAGFTDVILVVSPDGVIQNIVGDGKEFGLTITYVMQNEPSGAGDALLLAKQKIHDDFFVIWGSRVEFHEFAHELTDAKKAGSDGVILVKQTDDIAGGGVALLENGELVDIIEKPDEENPPSKLKIVGSYLLSKSFLATLEKIPSEHYSFEKALIAFAKEGRVTAVQTKKETLSLKYPWDILEIKDYLLVSLKAYTADSAKIAKNAVIEGNVYIEEEATIMENAVIKGPCYIGKKAYVGNNALLRGGAVIEKDVVIGSNMEIKNSVLLQGATTHSGFIGDSIIGEQSKIAAEFCTANVRLDRESVKAIVNEKEINSHMKSLGVMMGSNIRVGIHASTMPGIIIGKNVTIGPQTMVIKNVADDTKYYTKVQEIIEKKA